MKGSWGAGVAVCLRQARWGSAPGLQVWLQVWLQGRGRYQHSEQDPDPKEIDAWKQRLEMCWENAKPRPPVPGQGGHGGRLVGQQRLSHEHHEAQNHEHRVPVEQVLRVIFAVAFINWRGADTAEEGLHPVANEDEDGEPRSAGQPCGCAGSWRAYRPPRRLRDAVITSRHGSQLWSAAK